MSSEEDTSLSRCSLFRRVESRTTWPRTRRLTSGSLFLPGAVLLTKANSWGTAFFGRLGTVFVSCVVGETGRAEWLTVKLVVNLDGMY